MSGMKTQSKYTVETAVAAIEIAIKYESSATSMASSAKVAREDAQTCMNTERFEYAIKRSRDSIEYSVGRFSDPWKTITAML